MHVKEILAIAETCGANGIDIDYERIGKDPKLVEAFARFTKLLYLESIPTHKKIRIIWSLRCLWMRPTASAPSMW